MKTRLLEDEITIPEVLLSYWNLPDEKLDDAQRANDLEMPGFHCLDRLESVERTAVRLSQILPAM